MATNNQIDRRDNTDRRDNSTMWVIIAIIVAAIVAAIIYDSYNDNNYTTAPAGTTGTLNNTAPATTNNNQ
jgi:hypothetical protein